jgi:hypothetical protein
MSEKISLWVPCVHIAERIVARSKPTDWVGSGVNFSLLRGYPMTDVTFRVNRVSAHSVQVPLTYNDEPIMGHIQELEVELVPEEGQHGSATLRFRKAGEVEEARSVFAAGGTVKVSFSKGDDPVPTAVDTNLTEEPAPAAA